MNEKRTTIVQRARRVLKRLLGPILPKPKVSSQNEWGIAIYTGSSPFNLAPRRGRRKPVLTAADVSDIPARLVADPFMLRAGGQWYMFLEVLNKDTKNGEIGLAISNDGATWRYQQIVLREPFHLSYPYVFNWNGDYYMIPESYQAGAVRLYRATAFPTGWTFVGNLLEGPTFLDSSLVQYESRWWLFTETNPEHTFDTLRLYVADKLTGPWHEHPCSPIIAGDPHIARPAGRVVVHDGKVVRFAQDCFPYYGTQVRAFEVTELTPTSYQERLIGTKPVLAAARRGWNRSGMHHIDPHKLDDGRWIACVDGWIKAGLAY